MKTRLCIVTGSRADFGLLRWLMQDITGSDDFELQVIAVGSHLSTTFGETRAEITAAGFCLDATVDIPMTADSPADICRYTGTAMARFANTYQQLQPQLVIVLGDRYEIFAAASAALFCGYPLAHLMGGELSEGAIDEALRHSISKMASLHFVANDTYRQRVIQLGEPPERVFTVGGMGVDALHRSTPLSRAELEQSLGAPLLEKNLLVTFHPATLASASATSDESAEAQMQALLDALSALDQTRIIITFPNADAGYKPMISAITQFCADNPNALHFASLGQQRYLSLMRYVDAVVGNSSSGLAEAPSFGIPTVNIGDRQRGRMKASSVLDCPPEPTAILEAIQLCYQPEIRARAKSCVNPYGDPGAAKRIVTALESIPLTGLRNKHFHDIAVPPSRTEA